MTGDCKRTELHGCSADACERSVLRRIPADCSVVDLVVRYRWWMAFTISVEEGVLDLARRKGGVVAFDFIPPIS